MLADLDAKAYKQLFRNDPHPFISDRFLELNREKCDNIVRLAEDKPKAALGLTAGVKDGTLHSPFSAPFGGFHFRNELVYTGEIDEFLEGLKEYIKVSEYRGVELTLPPDLYHATFNAKTVNALIRGGFSSHLPEITSWIDLKRFSGEFDQKNSREYYRQAVRNGLTFEKIDNVWEMESAYDLICGNRKKFNRPIFMTFEDIMNTGTIWPVDFFKVDSPDGTMVASAVLYQSRQDICYAVFWGDNDLGRPLRAFDFLVFHLLNFYRSTGYHYIDLGISTESGYPNDGLLRFKESHNAVSSLRFKFSWFLDR